MSTKFKLLLFVFFLFHVAVAQQWRSYSPTIGFDINTVKIVESGHIVIGGGQESNDSLQIMFMTADYGLTWFENTHDGYASWNKSVAFADPVNGFGVGNRGRIIRSNDGGRNWGFSVYPTTSNLNKIVNVTPLLYYAVGGKQTNGGWQTILQKGNSDTTWNVVYDTAGPCLRSVYFTNTAHGISVGDSGVILATSNSGNSWANITAPLQRNFNGITFINANTGFIVGGNDSLRTILRTGNGGANWIVVSDTTGGMLRDISFADSLVGYAVGDSATILKTTDGGLNWTALKIDTNLTGNEQFRSVDFFNRGFGVVGGKGGVLYVYSLPLPYNTFQTQQVTSVTYTTATLPGVVDGVNVPMNLFFEYDTTLVFTNSVQAIPAQVTDTSLHTVSVNINSLQPLTYYYYRLKGVAGGYTYYGNILSFYTEMASTDTTFLTRTATRVTDTSALLNGTISNFYSVTPVQASFEYGTTASFGHELQAGSLSVNANSLYHVSATLTGLPVDTVYYYYRLKVVAGAYIYFGDTRQLHTGVPELPNWDFENWHTVSANLPSHWYISTDSFARVPGHSGNYALQITGPTIAVQGVPTSQNHPIGGAPFNARPDSFSVYINYAIDPADTAYILLYMTTGGQQASPFTVYSVRGNSGGNFQRLSFPITYSSSATPDSVLMGFINGNAFTNSDTIYMNNSMTIDDISFSGTSANLYNYDFESWFNYTVERPDGWKGMSYFIDSANQAAVPMVSKVNLNTPSDHAIQLRTIDLGGTLVQGELSTYEPFFKNTPDFPVSHRYQVLTGYYEYFPENGDSIQVSFGLKKGGKFGTGIGHGQYTFKQTQSTFAPFEIPIDYNTFFGDTTSPDWGDISFGTGEFPVSGHSRLILDKLRFDGLAAIDSLLSGISSPASTFLEGNGIRIYPNPVNNLLKIELSDAMNDESIIQLFNLDGQKQKEIRMPAGENQTSLNVADLSAGLYLIKWINGREAINKKIIVVK